MVRLEAMLSSPAARWPSGQWILQPRWDGYRLLVRVDSGRIRAFSRHGTEFSERLAAVLDPLAELGDGTILGDELVALSERDGRPIQDFAAIGRSVFGRTASAAGALHFVAFDLLCLANEDLRARPWDERDERLRMVLPRSRCIRVMRRCQPRLRHTIDWSPWASRDAS